MNPRVPFALAMVCLGCGSPGISAPRATQPAPCLAPSSPTPSAPGAATPSNAQPAARSAAAPAPPATFDIAAIDAYIASQMEPRGFVGLSVAIVKDGAIVLEKGYGKRQLTPDAPVQADTAFALASITKQFIGALVLQLATEKKLSVDDKVAKYFPDLTRASDITLYDLMTHVSGYRDNYPLDFVDREMSQPVTPDESIARYAKRPLDFEPRTRFSYSSTGYKILGRVIEKVTGKPLDVVMVERIFRPLGMAHSSYMPLETAPGLATGYTSFAVGPPEPATPEGRGWTYGGGGIYAPAGDVARWDIALMSGKVLGPEAYKFFSAPRTLADGGTSLYGCGILNWSRGGEQLLQHDGADSGFRGKSVLVPRTRSAVVVLANRDDSAPRDLVNEIVALMTKGPPPPPLKVEGASVTEAARQMFLAMQAGHVDRGRLGDDFNFFLTDAKLHAASARLRPLGAPTQVELGSSQERGGMEQSTVRLSLADGTKLEADMFRSVDGKVQQFLINKP